MSRDMLEFVGFVQQAVYRGMERELATVEKQNAQHKEKVSNIRQNYMMYMYLLVLWVTFQVNFLHTAFICQETAWTSWKQPPK